MSEPQAHETGSSKGKGERTKVAPEERPRDPQAERTARQREQMLLLIAASWCSKPHGPRMRATSAYPVLQQRIEAAAEMRLEDIEGDQKCEDCQRKLVPMAAGYLLAVLPSTPTPELLAVAKRLRSEQPMLWAAIQRAHSVHIAQVLQRSGKPHFSPSEYQQMASEAVAAMQSKAA